MTQITVPNNKTTGGVLGVIEGVLGDLTAVASSLTASAGVFVAFASNFSGGRAEAGIVLSAIGVAGLVARDVASALASKP